jgi:methyltransferase (TIGR00027 family)
MPVDASSLPQLALTAWWTAAARARESRRPDRLFDDPWAGVLIGPHGVDDYDRAVGGDSIHDLHAVTTRFFDDFLCRVTSTHGVRQVVLVASGLDARAFRLPLPVDTRLLELDQSHVIAYKDCILSLNHASPRCQRHTVGVNLNEPWTDHVLEAGFRPSEPAVWLIEQCLYFFDEGSARELLERITALSAPDSWIALDVVNRDMLTSPETRHWSARMSAAGTPWKFTTDEPAALLAEFGWTATVVEPGAHGADFGRYPYSLSPRTHNGVPRLFLVTAQQ